MSRRTVIVTDGEQRSALAIVRSLGAAGFRCVVTAQRRGDLAGASRFASRTVCVPDPLKAPGPFGDAVVKLVAEECADIIIPVSEPALLALLPLRAALSPAVLPFPDAEIFASLADKQHVLDEAAQLGIAVPAQRTIASPEQIDCLEPSGIAFPVVLKPSRSVGEHHGVRQKFGVSYARDVAELRARLRALPAAAFPVLLQQRIVGPGIGIFLLMWDGEPRAEFAHRRLCEKPPTGGVSVYRESVPVDCVLRDRSRALLERLDWKGVAMVEFKVDARTSTPYLMEINGRFWGSLQLAIDAGADFPRMLAAAALGDELPAAPAYRVGVRSRWWWGQMDHLVARARRRKAAPLPPDTVSVARAASDMLLGPFRRDDREEVFRWSDPKPFINETMRWIGA